MTDKAAIKSMPNGYNTVSAFMVVEDVPSILAFLKATFDAEVKSITYAPADEDGKRPIMNAEVQIGTSMVLLSEVRSGGLPAQVSRHFIYVEDVDAVHAKALAAGATEMMPPTDMFYGDRHGGVVDTAGNTWFIATHIEDITKEELQRRADDMHAAQQ